MTVTVNADPANKAIDFGGTNAFVTLGPAPGLGAARFTIETWFRRDGAGIATFTGTGGVDRDSAGHEGDGGSRRRQQPGHELLPRHPADGRRAGRGLRGHGHRREPPRRRHRRRSSPARRGTTPRRPTTAPRGGSIWTDSSSASWSSGRSRRASTAFSTRRSARRSIRPAASAASRRASSTACWTRRASGTTRGRRSRSAAAGCSRSRCRRRDCSDGGA